MKKIINKIGEQISIFEDGKNEVGLIITSDVDLDFSDYEFEQLRIDEGAVDIEKLSYKLITYIAQILFHSDRSYSLNLAVVAENHVRQQKHIVAQKKEENNIQVTENLFDKFVKEKVLENGSVIKVYLEPWIKINFSGN